MDEISTCANFQTKKTAIALKWLRYTRLIFWGVVCVVALYLALFCQFGVSVIFLPLGASLSIPRCLAKIFELSNTIGDLMIGVLVVASPIVHLTLAVWFSFTKRVSTAFYIAMFLFVLLMFDVVGCSESLRELKSVN